MLSKPYTKILLHGLTRWQPRCLRHDLHSASEAAAKKEPLIIWNWNSLWEPYSCQINHYRLVYTYDARTSISTSASVSHVWTGTTQAQAQGKGTRACAYIFVVRVNQPYLLCVPESFPRWYAQRCDYQCDHYLLSQVTAWSVTPASHTYRLKTVTRRSGRRTAPLPCWTGLAPSIAWTVKTVRMNPSQSTGKHVQMRNTATTTTTTAAKSISVTPAECESGWAADLLLAHAHWSTWCCTIDINSAECVRNPRGSENEIIARYLRRSTGAAE